MIENTTDHARDAVEIEVTLNDEDTPIGEIGDPSDGELDFLAPRTQ